MSAIGPIIVAIAVIIVTLILVGTGVYYGRKRSECESQESPYCLTIACPNDTPVSTCHGYASRPAEKDGFVYCSDAPKTMVQEL